jgi:hypothetical protein
MMSVYGCPTKKVLKGKVGQVASDVLQETSIFGPELKNAGKFPVVGPSPYSRKWYAEVTVTDGRIVKVV